MTDKLLEDQRPTRFLTVTGVLRPDGRLFLHPGFVTDDPATPVADAPDSPLVAELVDDEGRTILRSPIPVGPFAAEWPISRSAGPSVRAMPELAVAGVVPFPSATHRIRFLLRDVPIHELEVSDAPPKIEVAWDEVTAHTDGVQRLRWSASGTSDRELWSVVAYSNDGGTTWQPLSLPSPEAELDVDLGTLPGGRGRFRILVTDGTSTASVDSPVLRLPRRPLLVTIHEPAEGAELSADQLVLLHGEGYDLEEHRAELEALTWTSSRDGELGRGAVLHVSLSPGSHRISLTAGSRTRAAEASVSVKVAKATAAEPEE